MIIRIFLLFLQISFTAHIYFLVQFILRKENAYLKRFINTAISNIVLAGALTVLVIFRPDLIRDVNLKFLLWIMSGLIMLIMLMIKITIMRNMFKRSKDPANYHFNYFGKKVLHSKVVLQEEVYIFLFTIPFFLFCGAYFFARLVNLLLYKSL